ncbi:glycosyltransferase-like domain-containing protein 1 isoform X2 [Esox lucius]|uniref:glycosyltransferase-like domain-containing protein 1 isoform X2 n=1 Tax=Esox lucius TaxID=8010 RepID=UPI000576AB04|nr:glycosyltransferase-like domain-containing protein 1 isoform X2 [Esox lucius]
MPTSSGGVSKMTVSRKDEMRASFFSTHDIQEEIQNSLSMSVLLVEAFYGGSHKQLIDLLRENVEDCVAYTLPAKKWQWRARTAALYFMQAIPASPTYRVLFASSVLNLSELVALRPDLVRLKKVLYFHENQLVYPVRKHQDRDFQYGYNQVLSCLVADVVAFNSSFNMESFLSSISSFMKMIPDHRPKELDKLIRPKCRVLHFPILFPHVTRQLREPKLHDRPDESCVDDLRAPQVSQGQPPSPGRPEAQRPEELLCPVEEENEGLLSHHSPPAPIAPCLSQDPEDSLLDHKEGTRQIEAGPGGAVKGKEERDGEREEGHVRPLHIVWPHRWEHDKDPELFFKTLLKLKERGLGFQVSVLGETFTDVPAIFAEARTDLDAHILHWGFVPSKEDYLRVLCEADVVVSTAKHEFFGVAMIEAVHCGCYPLCPKALVYPEIFPSEYLYSTPEQLCKKLQGLCKRPDVVRRHHIKVDTLSFSWAALKEDYKSLLASQEDHLP